ncbi:MAG: glyceraldehyde 3-phosphate dehydrogenase NAD-binding domain-containing protein, partial [Terriglobales bacterium]
MRVGINGFGRIGRNLFRAALGDKRFQIAAINDITAPAMLAHLLKHDSVLGNLAASVTAESDAISVNGVRIPVGAQPDPAKIDWNAAGVELVAECSGRFSTRAGASLHLHDGV